MRRRAITYGVGAAGCSFDVAGPFRQALATMAIAAASTSSTDDAPGWCAPTESSDGAHYYREPGGTNLEDVFVPRGGGGGGVRLIE